MVHLYGTTYYGGGSGCAGERGCGAVYAVAADGTETVLHSFQGSSDGANPYSGLIQVGSKLYGTTSSGGAYNAGTVFSISP